MAYEFKCPHCENILRKMRYPIYKIGCPIQSCPHCSKDYNDPYIYEWSIISPFHKLFYCFLASGRIILLLIAANYFLSREYPIALLWTIIWLTVSMVQITIRDSQKIKESHQRTQNNPEYIKKLSDLGCTSMDIRIDPYYK